MRYIVPDDDVLEVGYQAENQRDQFAFPLDDFIEEYPGGWAMLLLQRPKDKDVIVANDTVMDGNSLVWTARDYELKDKGYMKAQIVYAVGNVVAKTKRYRFHIAESLITVTIDEDTFDNMVNTLATSAANVNTAIQDAYATLDEKVDAAEEAVTNAEAAQEAAETAQNAAETAQGKAEAAQAAAETAQQLAETAQTAAEEARTGAVTAETGAEDAKAAAGTAKRNAETAQAKAETAQRYSEAAQNATEAARADALSANSAAQAAKTATEAARQRAEAARDTAVNEAAAATDARIDANSAMAAAQNAQSNAEGYAWAAANSAARASTSETNANTDALKAEGYAVGKQNGTDATSGQPYYQDNAKYYASVAQSAKTDAVAAKDRAETVVDGIEDAGATQVAAVQAKGTEVLNSIPADYTQMTEDVDELKSALEQVENKQETVIYGNAETTVPTLVYLNLTQNATRYIASQENGYNTKYIAVNKKERCVFEIRSARTGQFRFGFATSEPANSISAVYLGDINLTGVENGTFEYIPQDDGYLSVSYWYDIISELVITKNDGGIIKDVSAIPSLVSKQEGIIEWIDNIDPNVRLSVNDFDIGNITITDSGFSYGSSASRIRTKPGTTIHLKPGDVISLSSYTNARYYLGWHTSTGYDLEGWLTSDYTVVDEGDYVILITAVPEGTVLNVNDLFELLSIKNASSIINTISEKANAAYDLAESHSEDIIDLQSEMQTVTGNVKVAEDFEIGNIFARSTATTPSEWSYENSNYRIRTKRGLTYSFPAGTKIEIKPGADVKMWIAGIVSGTTTVISHNSGATYLKSDGIYAFVLAYNPETIISNIPQLANRLVVTLPKINENAGLMNPILRPATPKLIAHRGDDTLAPENSVPAFAFAGKAHAWAIETDVQETEDGYFICMHDDTVDRTTNGTGNVITKTLAEIEALTIDTGANIDEYPNLKVPTLGEYLKVCKRYGAVAFVEIKNVNNYENLISEFKKHGMIGSTVLIARNEATVMTVRTVSNIPVALLVDIGGNINTAVAIAKAADTWICANFTLCTNVNVQLAHMANVPFTTWTRTQSSDVIADLENGADAVTVNGITNIVIDD